MSPLSQDVRPLATNHLATTGFNLASDQPKLEYFHKRSRHPVSPSPKEDTMYASQDASPLPALLVCLTLVLGMGLAVDATPAVAKNKVKVLYHIDGNDCQPPATRTPLHQAVNPVAHEC